MKPKQAYNVYIRDYLFYGDGRKDKRETLLETIYATSKERAIINVARIRGYDDNNMYCSWSDGGYRKSELFAVETQKAKQSI